MESMRERWSELGRERALLAVYAFLIGAASVAVYAGDAADGHWAAIGRVALGLWGAAAGLLLWSGRGGGLPVLIWAVLQIPIVAWDSNGSPTTQLLQFPISASTRTTINGRVTDASEIGVNLVGIALAVWASRLRGAAGVRGWGTARTVAPASYDVEHRPGAGEPRQLAGGVGDPAAAGRAAVSQAARLRAQGERGEVVVVRRPDGAVVGREVVAEPAGG